MKYIIALMFYLAFLAIRFDYVEQHVPPPDDPQEVGISQESLDQYPVVLGKGVSAHYAVDHQTPFMGYTHAYVNIHPEETIRVPDELHISHALSNDSPIKQPENIPRIDKHYDPGSCLSISGSGSLASNF
jgi:hypothetical protein